MLKLETNLDYHLLLQRLNYGLLFVFWICSVWLSDPWEANWVKNPKLMHKNAFSEWFNTGYKMMYWWQFAFLLFASHFQSVRLTKSLSECLLVGWVINLVIAVRTWAPNLAGGVDMTQLYLLYAVFIGGYAYVVFQKPLKVTGTHTEPCPELKFTMYFTTAFFLLWAVMLSLNTAALADQLPEANVKLFLDKNVQATAQLQGTMMFSVCVILFGITRAANKWQLTMFAWLFLAIVGSTTPFENATKASLGVKLDPVRDVGMVLLLWAMFAFSLAKNHQA